LTQPFDFDSQSIENLLHHPLRGVLMEPTGAGGLHPRWGDTKSPKSTLNPDIFPTNWKSLEGFCDQPIDGSMKSRISTQTAIRMPRREPANGHLNDSNGLKRIQADSVGFLTKI